MERLPRSTQPEKAAQVMGRLIDVGIRPHLRRIRQIEDRGRLPVVVFEPAIDSRPILHRMGWNGYDPVFGMPNGLREAFAESLAHDPVGQRWLRSDAKGRIFVCVHRGTILMNHTKTGFEIEPGSLDAEVFKA